MKYSAGQLMKSIVAFATGLVGAATVAAGGPDLSVLGFGEWLAAAAAGLTSAGFVFATPNKDAKSAAEQVLAGIPMVVQQAKEAQESMEKVRQAADEALGSVPVFGPAAQQVISNLPRY